MRLGLFFGYMWKGVCAMTLPHLLHLLLGTRNKKKFLPFSITRGLPLLIECRRNVYQYKDTYLQSVYGVTAKTQVTERRKKGQKSVSEKAFTWTHHFHIHKPIHSCVCAPHPSIVCPLEIYSRICGLRTQFPANFLIDTSKRASERARALSLSPSVAILTIEPSHVFNDDEREGLFNGPTSYSFSFTGVATPFTELFFPIKCLFGGGRQHLWPYSYVCLCHNPKREGGPLGRMWLLRVNLVVLRGKKIARAASPSAFGVPLEKQQSNL